MMSGWLPRMFQHVPRIVGHKWGCIQPGSNVLGFEGCLRLAVECINYSAYVYTSIINYIQIITILTNDLPGIKYGILFSHLQMCFPFKPESYRISHCHVWWPVFFSSLLLVVALWLKILKVQMFTYAHAGAWDWEWMLGARHVLALLSVFVLGVVVGHLLKPEKKYVSWLPWDLANMWWNLRLGMLRFIGTLTCSLHSFGPAIRSFNPPKQLCYCLANIGKPWSHGKLLYDHHMLSPPRKLRDAKSSTRLWSSVGATRGDGTPSTSGGLCQSLGDPWCSGI